MKKSLVALGVAVAAVLLTTPAFAQNRGVTFTPIGFIEDPGPFPASNILAMNPQGDTFVASPSFRNTYGVIWTREGGWGREIGNLAPPVRLSSEGVVMTSGLYPGSNYVWPGTWLGQLDAFEPIAADAGYEPCGSSRMSFYDMSDDGNYAVGLSWGAKCSAYGFLWNRSTNTSIGLGTPNGRSTRANAVTCDGKAVIGWGTALFGTRRGAVWQNGTWQFLNDPAGLEPKACVTTPKNCTSNSADPVYGCPEYVDDGSCPASSKGVCTAGVCVGGFDNGKNCTSTSQCGGTCLGGPNNGLRCTSNSNCPDTNVCVANPLWHDDLFKGEAFDATPDGNFIIGRNFDYSTGWDSGYRRRPDGTYDRIPVLPDFPYIVNPIVISDNSFVVGGYAGGPLFGFAPFIWTELTGTLDLQLFLIGQGLDELYFWYLVQVNAISADGMVIAGLGVDPDNLQQGWIVDMHRVLVCRNEAGESACSEGADEDCGRTMRVDFRTVQDPSELGSCEFKRTGGLTRAQDLRRRLIEKHKSGAFSSVLKLGTIRTEGQNETRMIGSDR